MFKAPKSNAHRHEQPCRNSTTINQLSLSQSLPTHPVGRKDENGSLYQPAPKNTTYPTRRPPTSGQNWLAAALAWMGVGRLMPFASSADSIGSGSFISRKDLMGGGTLSPCVRRACEVRGVRCKDTAQGGRCRDWRLQALKINVLWKTRGSDCGRTFS